MLGFVLPPSWSRYATKLASLFNNVDVSVLTAFWLFGLINNLLYVILLSAAQDLVGSSTPKSLVLLADVLPSFVIKLFAPYAIHLVPYHSRIIAFVILSSTGMLLIALAPQASIPLKLLGVILASISSGGGELTFLGLTHHYGGLALAAWGSGTGGAGLAGAGYYVLFTSVLKLSVEVTLLTSATLPLVMLLTYAAVLPRSLIMNGNNDMAAITEAEEHTCLPSTNNGEDDDSTSIEDQDCDDDDILPNAATASLIPRPGATTTSSPLNAHTLRQNLRCAKSLFVPYMLPLFLVYVSEYLINQGVSPTLLFPIDASPFDEMRSFYPFYGFLYQLGVFISRSSMPFVRIHHLYLPSFLQVFNLAVLTAQALFDFIPTVYIVFIIIFWEGLLGGAVYVNTFAEIMENVPPSEREFSLSATSVSDSAGICTAGFLGLVVEVWLCNWQVRHGRDWCKKVDVGA